MPRISRRGPPPAAATARHKALPWVVLGVGLCAIAGLFALAPRHPDTSAAASATVKPQAPPSQAPPADPNDLGVKDPSAADPAEILGRAKVRALAWSKEAQLVSLRAQPVSNTTVNLTSGGTIEYWFGKPTGEGFGSGARVNGKRLHIKLGAGGTEVEEVPAGLGRAALDPNCPLDEAVRKATASGVPQSASLNVSYEVSDKHQKPVWRFTTNGPPATSRIVDGWSCAILVR